MPKAIGFTPSNDTLRALGATIEDESLDGYCGAAPDAARRVLEKRQAAKLAPMDDPVTIERADLRRLALVRHERPGYNGTFVPNGGSCKICKVEWDRNEPELHAENCPLNLKD